VMMIPRKSIVILGGIGCVFLFTPYLLFLIKPISA